MAEFSFKDMIHSPVQFNKNLGYGEHLCGIFVTILRNLFCGFSFQNNIWSTFLDEGSSHAATLIWLDIKRLFKLFYFGHPITPTLLFVFHADDFPISLTMPSLVDSSHSIFLNQYNTIYQVRELKEITRSLSSVHFFFTGASPFPLEKNRKEIVTSTIEFILFMVTLFKSIYFSG